MATEKRITETAEPVTTPISRLCHVVMIKRP
jgi:hypothetical protein